MIWWLAADRELSNSPAYTLVLTIELGHQLGKASQLKQVSTNKTFCSNRRQINGPFFKQMVVGISYR